MENNQKQFIYDPSEGVYTFEGWSKPIEVIQPSVEKKKAYFLEEYETLFSGFDEKKHFIKEEEWNGEAYLVVHERGESKLSNEAERPDPGFYQVKRNEEPELKPGIRWEEEDHLPLRSFTNELRENVCKYFRQNEASTRGTLLYGPGGNGKRHTMYQVAKTLISEMDGYVFTKGSRLTVFSDLEEIQEIFEEKPVLFLIDHIEQKSRIRDEVINVLDHGNWKNTYILASTSDPEGLAEREAFTANRFERVIPVDNPDARQRRKFLQHKLGDERVTDELVEETDGENISSLEDLAQEMEVYDRTETQALQQLRKRKKHLEEDFRVAG